MTSMCVCVCVSESQRIVWADHICSNLIGKHGPKRISTTTPLSSLVVDVYLASHCTLFINSHRSYHIGCGVIVYGESIPCFISATICCCGSPHHQSSFVACWVYACRTANEKCISNVNVSPVQACIACEQEVWLIMFCTSIRAHVASGHHFMLSNAQCVRCTLYVVHIHHNNNNKINSICLVSRNASAACVEMWTSENLVRDYNRDEDEKTKTKISLSEEKTNKKFHPETRAHRHKTI